MMVPLHPFHFCEERLKSGAVSLSTNASECFPRIKPLTIERELTMDTKVLAGDYDRLTPEERYFLIVAAGARGDEIEQGRLSSAGKEVHQSVLDHSPYCHALQELNNMISFELFDAAVRLDEECRRLGEWDKKGMRDLKSAAETTETNLSSKAFLRDSVRWQKRLNWVLAAGFVLRIKAEGWKLFCDRHHIPPFAFMKLLPGFERFERALSIAEKVSFNPEGFSKWLNRMQKPEDALVTKVLTAEDEADSHEHFFQERARWWGGK